MTSIFRRPHNSLFPWNFCPWSGHSTYYRTQTCWERDKMDLLLERWRRSLSFSLDQENRIKIGQSLLLVLWWWCGDCLLSFPPTTWKKRFFCRQRKSQFLGGGTSTQIRGDQQRGKHFMPIVYGCDFSLRSNSFMWVGQSEQLSNNQWCPYFLRIFSL